VSRRTIADKPEQTDSAGGVNRLYAVLTKVNEAMVRVREPQALYEEACRIAVEDGQFLLAWIGFVERGSDYIRPLARFGRDDGYLDNAKLSLNADVPEGRGPTGVALREGRAFINNDTENNPIMRPWRDAQLKRGFKSSASFPLLTDGKTVGVITLYAGEAGYFDEEEVRLLTTLADDFSFALESAARRESSRLLASTTLLLEAAEQLSRSNRLDSVLERLADIVLRATDHSRVYVGLLSEDRSHVTFAPNLGQAALPSGTVVPWDGLSLPLQEVLTTGETRVAEYSNVPVGLRGIADTVRSRTALLVPILVDGRVLGHIAVDDPEHSRVFTHSEIEIVEGVAHYAAAAIENARLFDEARDNARLGEALNVANAAVHSTLEIDQVMQHALETGVSALGCDAGAIETLEGDGWVVRYESGFSPDVVGTRLSKRLAPNATQAARQRVAYAIDDLSHDKRRNVGFVKRYGLKSVLAVPLIGKGNVIGCALFYTGREVKHFTEAEIDFGRKLGSAASTALSNARSYGTERNIANVLQDALLTLPASVAGFEFANSYSSATVTANVGGDFYDIFELDEHCVGVTIGDVSGKGLDAAVLTSLLRNSIRAYATEPGKGPAKVLKQANALFHRFTPTEIFATVFFGIVDRRDGRILYANAGHPAAALVRDGGRLERLARTGPLLGAFESVPYAEREACLGSGDLLFLYTDGLIEARRDGVQYGEERLFEFLRGLRDKPVSDVVEAVLAEVGSFATAGLRDDLATLALRLSDA
jgi:GAF domain-containing protein